MKLIKAITVITIHLYSVDCPIPCIVSIESKAPVLHALMQITSLTEEVLTSMGLLTQLIPRSKYLQDQEDLN